MLCCVSLEHKTVCMSCITRIHQRSVFTVVVLAQAQQPLEDLDAQLRRALSPETTAVTSAVGVSFANLVKSSYNPNILSSWDINCNLDY